MKTSKTKNVSNFEQLVKFVDAQGPVYNPGKDAIQMAALQSLLTQARVQTEAADVLRQAYAKALIARREMTKQIPILSGAIISVLQSNGTSSALMERMRALKAKLSPPTRTKKKTIVAAETPGAPTTTLPAPHQRSQMDVASVIRNFAALVNAAIAEPTYVVNEEAFKPAVLTAFVAALVQAQSAVTNAREKWLLSEKDLSTLTYSVGGIYGRAKDTKAYLRVALGARSAKFGQISSLYFNNH
jgi:hypothetical protein